VRFFFVRGPKYEVTKFDPSQFADRMSATLIALAAIGLGAAIVPSNVSIPQECRKGGFRLRIAAGRSAAGYWSPGTIAASFHRSCTSSTNWSCMHTGTTPDVL
jgi:hypothetical protein